MRSDNKTRWVFETEQEFRESARAYLSEAFPNPERKGCPPDAALKTLARSPKESDKSLGNHLTCCSPCFNAYMAHLKLARSEIVPGGRIRRPTWTSGFLVAGSAAIIVIFACAFFMRLRTTSPIASTLEQISKPATNALPLTKAYMPVFIDLSNASPVRGVYEGEAGRSIQAIPSGALLALSLLLPLGSEDRVYAISLSSSGHVVWSDFAEAHLESGQVFLHMRTDFSHVSAGNYELIVQSGEDRLTVPVLVSSSSGRTQ